jgi:hypothetical protein
MSAMPTNVIGSGTMGSKSIVSPGSRGQGRANVAAYEQTRIRVGTIVASGVLLDTLVRCDVDG